MAWPQDDQEKARRVAIAKELTRQEFWMAVYTASVSNGDLPSDSSHRADVALLDFDMKFGGKP